MDHCNLRRSSFSLQEHDILLNGGAAGLKQFVRCNTGLVHISQSNCTWREILHNDRHHYSDSQVSYCHLWYCQSLLSAAISFYPIINFVICWLNHWNYPNSKSAVLCLGVLSLHFSNHIWYYLFIVWLVAHLTLRCVLYVTGVLQDIIFQENPKMADYYYYYFFNPMHGQTEQAFSNNFQHTTVDRRNV